MSRAGVIIVSVLVTLGLVSIIAATVLHSVKKIREAQPAQTSAKAVMCNSAEYKDTCEDSLRNADSSDPQALMRVHLEAIMSEVHAAIKRSFSLRHRTDESMTRQAIDICCAVLEDSLDTLKRAFDRVDTFDPHLMDEYVEDLKIWVSGVYSDQTVCKDGFKNAPGDFGDKIDELLEEARKLTVTALDMINQLDNLLGSIKIESVTRRRLLAGGWERRVLAVNVMDLQPEVVVARDGSGKYMTINEALKEVPKNNFKPFVIYVKEGVYEEQVKVLKYMTNVVLAGAGPEKTKITGSLSYKDGFQTFKTATVSILATDFIAKDIGFENAAGPKAHQAVALRVQGDRAMFLNCRIDGFQDTLYAQKFRQFYRDCTVTGTVDFIFGDAAVVFQNCNLVARKPRPGQNVTVTAQGKDARQEVTGTVLHNCVISAEPALIASAAGYHVYLGRPWRRFATTVVIQSEIGGIVDAEGWAEWGGTTNADTCYFAEFGNRGPGAAADMRVAWKGYRRIDAETAQSFVPAKFFLGDVWIPQTAIPYDAGWMNV